MPVPALNREELLNDSEATLREAAGVLLDLWDMNETGTPAAPEGVVEFPPRDVASLYEDLPLGIRWGVQEIQSIQHQIREGLVRASDLLDRISCPTVDGITPVLSRGERRRALASELQDEIRRLITLLRSHDLVAKKLASAAGVLAEADEELAG